MWRQYPKSFGNICSLVLLLLSITSQAAALEGKVIRILDGDTIEILDAETTPHKVRLAGIDAPEKGQAFGSVAKRHLASLVFGRVVEVESHKRDKYRRVVGKIVYDGQDMNLEMVSAGYAWWYRKYSGEQSSADRRRYEEAEAFARAERVGLWADKAPMAPWEWRHRPEPPGGYAAACPCWSGKVCIGQRGGRFCIRESGTKKYFPQPR